MPRYVCRCSSTPNEVFSDWSAVIDLDDSFCRLLKERAELLLSLRKRDAHAYELAFWSPTESPEFYSYDFRARMGMHDLLEKVDERLDEADWLQLSSAEDDVVRRWDDLLPEKVECTQMVFSADPHGRIEVQWVTIPRHSDAYVTTARWDVAELIGPHGHHIDQTSQVHFSP